MMKLHDRNLMCSKARKRAHTFANDMKQLSTYRGRAWHMALGGKMLSNRFAQKTVQRLLTGAFKKGLHGLGQVIKTVTKAECVNKMQYACENCNRARIIHLTEAAIENTCIRS